MVSSATLHRYAFSDYLALEEASNTKHEFLNGEIYAMAGGTPEHAALAVATSAALLTQLAGGPCRVYSSDLRVRVLATGLATYPDVTVVCGPMERDPESADTVTNPRLVVEVTSKGTEAYDRGEKLDQYRSISSLQAVVLVCHRKPEIEVWEPAADGTWGSRSFGSGQTAEVQALGVRLVVDDIYAAAREPGA
jgi:Uma2 family endonuclease